MDLDDAAATAPTTNHRRLLLPATPKETTTTTTLSLYTTTTNTTTNNNNNINSNDAKHSHKNENHTLQQQHHSVSSRDFHSHSAAMQFSHDASVYLQQGLLEESLASYRHAAECYERILTASATAATTTSTEERRPRRRRRRQQLDNNLSSGEAWSPPSQQQPSQQGNSLVPLILCTINAAGCYRNMGAVSRLLRNYGQASAHLQGAEELYRTARHDILDNSNSRSSSSSRMGTAAKQQQDPHNGREKERTTEFLDNAAAASAAGEQEELCLDFMILETMLSRAFLYTEHLDSLILASQCHDHCIAHVLHLAAAVVPGGSGSSSSACSSTGSSTFFQEPVVVDSVRFTPLSTCQQTEIVMASVGALCELFRGSSSSNGEKDATTTLMCKKTLDDQFPMAILFLKQRWMDANEMKGDSVVNVILLVQLFRDVSDLYFEYEEWDRALEILQNAMGMEVSTALANISSSSISPIAAASATIVNKAPLRTLETFEAMDEMGLAHERMEHFDRALGCYEAALLARSRYYGDDATHNSIDVAQSLVRVARIMELQGNTEGGLDLYRAAHAMYALQIVTSDNLFDCPSDAECILQLIPNLLEQHRFEEARSYLTKCLAIADNEDPKLSLSLDENSILDGDAKELPNSSCIDKSQIYFDLGRAYIGLRDYVSATICLVEAAKEEGRVTEEQVLVLLQSIDVLQREGSRSLNSSSSSSKRNAKHLAIRTSRSLDATDEKQQHVHDRIILRKSSSRDGAVSLPSRDMRQASVGKRERKDLVKLYHSQSFISSSNPFVKSYTMPKILNSRSSLASTTPTFELESEVDPMVQREIFDQSKHHDFRRDSCVEDTVNDSGLSSFWDNDDTQIAQSRSGEDPLLKHGMTPSSDETFEEEPSPLSSDSNMTPGIHDLRSLRGRKLGAEKTPQHSRPQKPFISKVWRPRSRQGFQSLPDEKQTKTLLKDVQVDEDVTEDDTTITGPVAILNLDGTTLDDDISDITMRFDNIHSSHDTSQEWWWGVTSEGFRRWFPASYVSQAVQAADAFLSAKSIHSKLKTFPTSPRSISLGTENASCHENESDANCEYASNAGITSTRASRARIPIMSAAYGGHRAKPAFPLDHSSMFQSPSPKQNSRSDDILSEISTCRTTLGNLQQELGQSHAKVSMSLFTLAVLYSRNRDVEAAMECATEALCIQMENKESKDVAQSLHFLADLHLHQKEYKQSLILYSKAVKTETGHFGYFSDEVAKSLNCIGTVQSLQLDFRAAMGSHEEAFRILQEIHGEDLQFPLVAETLRQIGGVFHQEKSVTGLKSSDFFTFIDSSMLEHIGRAHEDSGCYSIAIAFFDEKLQFLENEEDSSETLEEAAGTLNSLGMLNSRAGLFFEAIEYYEKALSIQLQLGCDNVQLSTARVLTGAVQFQLGHWHQALELFQDALCCLKGDLGERHETVAATLYQIGVVQAALGKFDTAQECLNNSLKIQNDLLGPDHPATLRTRREIGNVFTVFATKRHAALEHFESVLSIQKCVHGDRHPNIAETLHSIGRVYMIRGDFAEALSFLEECYYMRVEFFGWDHPLQASTFHDIAIIHLQCGRDEMASRICQVVIHIRRNSLSENHIDIARVLATQASCCVAQGDTDKAAVVLSEALEMARESLGEDHPFLAEIFAELGALHLQKCQFDAARTSIQKALDIYARSNLEEDYNGIQEAREKFDHVARDELLCV